MTTSQGSASDPPPAAPVEGRRCRLTLLFLDLSRSSVLAEQLEAEEFAEILQATHDICRAAVVRCGGHIMRIQGDGALAVFGYPQASEDDARHAAEAALEAHALVTQIAAASLPAAFGPLQLHSGIHAGVVLVTQGDIEKGVLDLVGDAPHTAARLAAIAPPGAILANLEALGPQAGHFVLGAPEMRPLPGRSAAVRAAQVLGRSGQERRLNAVRLGGLTPFVGRESILASVTRLLAALHQGSSPQLLQLRGEAGIGKSRLLEEIAGLPEAQRCECVRGYCENDSVGEVLQPFVQIERALEARRNALAGAVEITPPAPRAARILQLLGTPRPTLVLLDDWQWADDASRQLLGSVLALDAPILVVLAARRLADEAGPATASSVLDLSPFTLAQTRATVARWLPGADPFVAAEIHQYAGGVPLLIEELCHSFEALGDAGGLGSAIARAGSGWLSSVVASRLGRLLPRQRELVQTAAVLGTAFARWLLDAVTRTPATADELAALASDDFLLPAADGGLRFKHGLTRDAVLETVGLRERTRIHLRVVDVLAKRAIGDVEVDTCEALAYHSGAARLWQEATRWGELAGDKAAQLYAFDRARARYLETMDAIEHGRPLVGDAAAHWCRVAHKLGMTCIFDPLALPEALQIFERGLTLAQASGDAALLARSTYWLGYLCYGFGRPRRAAEHCRTALRLARAAGDQRLSAQVEAALGQALAAACDYCQAVPMMALALRAKEHGRRGAGSGVAVGSAFTLACQASVQADQGDFTQAHRLLDEARALLGDTVHPVVNSVRNWSMVVLAWQGRWDDTIAVADEAARSAERSRSLLPLVISRAVGGYARWMRDGSLAGFGQLAEAVHWMEQRRGTFFISIYYGWLVEGCIAQQRIEPARGYAARLAQRSRSGELLGQAVGHRALALEHHRRGREPLAWAYLARAEAGATQRQSRREEALNMLCRAELLQRTGQHRAAASLADDACRALRAMDRPGPAARAASAWRMGRG